MQQRVYYLDVLRALAIMMVFTAHTVLSYGAPAALAPLQYGGTGVDLFFMLSGWLIGSQLFAEHKKFGNIDVKRFWIRRWMRTMPAYYLVLFATLVQLYLTKDTVASPLPYFIFAQNYDHLSYFSVSWSLCVEEQFYLLIAPLLTHLTRLTPRVQTLILLALFLMPSAFRTLGWYNSVEETHVRWDCCLVGVLLAQLYYQHEDLWARIKTYQKQILWVGISCYLLFYLFRWVKPFDSYSDPSLLVLGMVFASMVFYSVNTPIFHKPFGYRAVMLISTRSYSMYLLHPEALAVMRRLGSELPFFFYYVGALVLTLIASELLYRFVEVTFIDMRARFRFSSKRSSIVWR